MLRRPGEVHRSGERHEVPDLVKFHRSLLFNPTAGPTCGPASGELVDQRGQSVAGHVATLRSTRSSSVFDSIGFLRNPAAPEYSARSRHVSSGCPVIRMTLGASA